MLLSSTMFYEIWPCIIDFFFFFFFLKVFVFDTDASGVVNEQFQSSGLNMYTYSFG